MNGYIRECGKIAVNSLEVAVVEGRHEVQQRAVSDGDREKTLIVVAVSDQLNTG